jgi:hypothetical protein
MTDRERIQHNARTLLPRVRGMTKGERRQLYVGLRMGIILWPVVILGAVMPSSKHPPQAE